MNTNGKRAWAKPSATVPLAMELTCVMLFGSSAFAEKGGKKKPPPPQPPAGWAVIMLEPSGWYDWAWSIGCGVSGGQQAGAAAFAPGMRLHASLWSGSRDSWVDLHPSGSEYESSEAYGVAAGRQVGYVKFAPDSPYPYSEHAALWAGSPEIWVDLHPAWARGSRAYRVSGDQQVGFGTVYNATHAALWSGAPESGVDLHPSGTVWEGSAAYGIDEGQQVGIVNRYDEHDQQYHTHASLWSGTPESWVDIHPQEAIESYANDVSDGQQVGSADFFIWNKRERKYITQRHAGTWNGTAASWVDLHPDGYEGSWAGGASHGYQAGSAWLSDGFEHAGVWSGTPESWIDLGALLHPYYWYSAAEDIEVTDTDVWVVGWACWWDLDWVYYDAVMWHKKLSP